ncbi:MAG: hypothetical protein ACXWU1_09660 [Allosphingosinicella sp.]
MRKPIIIGALFASALAVTGCGQGEEKAATVGNELAANAAAQAPADAPAASLAENQTAAPGVMTSGTTQEELSIVNNTGQTVMRLANSVAGEDDWGGDMLAMQTLPNGETAQTSFGRGADQCLWDLRATFDGGETRDWRGVNLCEVSTVTLTPA